MNPGHSHVSTLLLSVPDTGHEAQGGHHGDAPLLDFDGTFFIQLALFLIVIAVLRTVLFKPWLALQAEREDRIEGEKRRAQDLDRRAAEILSDYEARIARARQIGNEERLKRRAEATAQEREVVGRARQQGEQAIAAQAATLGQQREDARIKLVSGAQAIGRAMASRILGREIAS